MARYRTETIKVSRNGCSRQYGTLSEEINRTISAGERLISIGEPHKWSDNILMYTLVIEGIV